MSLLEFQNVFVNYGPIQAVKDVSLKIDAGEIVTILGANGAGKSTLLMSVYSQPTISMGNILLNGQPIQNRPTHTITQLGISIAPERRRIFPKLTTAENLWIGAYGQSKKSSTTLLNEVYELFPKLFERQSQRAGTLSGGEQQMLAIGRALMSQPKLLLLDEPSLGLAPQTTQHLFQILKKINQSGTTLLLVEQNAYAALSIAHRGYVLVNGQVSLTGHSEGLRHNPEVIAAYL
jgi:branched-chain amino acid transport system ATP-binding protein